MVAANAKISHGAHLATGAIGSATVLKTPRGTLEKNSLDADRRVSVQTERTLWSRDFAARAVNYLFEGGFAVARIDRGCCILLRAYDLDFDQVALNPKLTHEEKIRLLVLLQHVWTDGEQVFPEGVPPDLLEAEIQALRPEIERRLVAEQRRVA